MRDNLNKNNLNFFEENSWETGNNNYKTPIIVGFDPGVNVGIAILDLNGKLIFLNSFKEISKSEIINIIMKYGKAVIIATDVGQIPKAVKKLASSLNSKIHSPKNDIQVFFKNKVVDDYLNNHNNLNLESSNKLNKNLNTIPNEDNQYSINFDAHGRDSLFAAIFAFKNYENKLNQVEKKFFENLENIIESEDYKNYNILNPNFDYEANYIEKLDQVKTLLINEVPISIAIDSVLNDELNNENNNLKNFKNIYETNLEKDNNDNLNNLKENFSENKENLNIEEMNKLKGIIKSQEKRIKNQEKLLNNLNSKNKDLIKKINDYDAEINKLKDELKDLNEKYSKNLLKEKTIASKVQLLKTIQKKYIEEKQIRKSLEEKLNLRVSLDDFTNSDEVTPLKIVDFFTRNSINETSKIFGIKKGDILIINSPEGGGSQTAKILADFNIKAILTYGIIPQQAEEVFEEENIPIILANDLKIKFFNDFAVINTKILESEIEKWKEYQRKKMEKKAQNELLGVIGDYKAKRRRTM